MQIDPYASCPCGSGKKFKRCCQPIHAEIERALEQDEQGQHEAALRRLEQVTNAHADNPEAWGQRSLLLYRNGKAEEAEAMLQKAFALNPNYPFGHFLQGQYRLNEGELAGALILFRKAADLYDPTAHAMHAEIQYLIHDVEMKLNRPVAARAAVQILLRHDPSNAEVRKGIDAVFGPENPNLPPLATQPYAYKPVGAARRARWEQAIAGAAAESGRLGDVAKSLEIMVAEDPTDSASWYNLGLTCAWMGIHQRAVEALDRYVALESDDAQASQAWALAEVLRCGQGMEDLSDHVEHSAIVTVRDPQRFVAELAKLEKERLVGNIRVDQEEGVLTGILIEPPTVALTPEAQARQMPRLGAYFVLMGNMLRAWNVHKESLDRSFEALRQRTGLNAGDAYPFRGPAKFPDVHSEAIVFPVGVASPEERETRLRAHFNDWFEEKWIRKPLVSLGGSAAVDAVGHPVLRKKVLGVLLFLEQCAGLAHFPYDFARLRRRLNLAEGAGATSAAAPMDLSSASAPELAAVAAETLDDAQLETAFQSAMKLDARDIAGKFARALVARAPRPERTDRYVWHNHLVNLALADGDAAGALDRINEGESDDCTNNGGKRRNDYELRRGQVLAKKGDAKEAAEVFDRLIGRLPDDLKIRGTATETMLSAKQGALARKYGEEGLAQARKQNNRDSEGHFLELLEAARRQG